MMEEGVRWKCQLTKKQVAKIVTDVVVRVRDVVTCGNRRRSDGCSKGGGSTDGRLRLTGGI